MSAKRVIAVDLGAESGRVMQAAFDGERIQMDVAYRFENTPVVARGTRYWDVLHLWHHIQRGIQQIADTHAVASIGVDSWGVDFALLDRDGTLLANPVHYRDERNDGMMTWVFQRMPRREIFQRTGIQFMQINGLYGLAALAKADSPLLEAADALLTIPDLFNYWLSGSKTCEFTHATTTQLYNPTADDWERDLLDAIGVPTEILTPVTRPGDIIGAYEGISVITPACHDTGSAVVAVPTTTENYAYLSSGTWSLLGIEVDTPIISDATYAANFTNEGGVYGTFRLLKNIMGLWLAQQCRETWQQQGEEYTYEALVEAAKAAEPFRTMIDPDDSAFLAHGDMPARIREYCQQMSQPVPETVGQVMRTIYESLALKYRYVLDTLIDVSGKEIDRLHIIGGGVHNALLCQMTADAIERPVTAGPVEATALGNAVVQFITHGALENLAQARQMLAATINTTEYLPEDTAQWAAQYAQFCELMAQTRTFAQDA